jgi:hypothetical protein
VARVEETPVGPKLYVYGVFVHRWLGCVHDAEARFIAGRINEAAHPPAAPQPEQCSWTQDDEGSDAWFAGCGKGWFRLDDGTPSSNGMSHCCYCGKPLVEVPWTEPEGDE